MCDVVSASMASVSSAVIRKFYPPHIWTSTFGRKQQSRCVIRRIMEKYALIFAFYPGYSQRIYRACSSLTVHNKWNYIILNWFSLQFYQDLTVIFHPLIIKVSSWPTFNSAFYRVYLWLQSHCILFVSLLFFRFFVFLMLLEAPWSFLELPETFGHFMMLHYASYCFLLIVDSSWQVFIVFFKRLPQHKNNSKPTNKSVWFWEPQAFAKISTVKKHCQRITWLIRTC